MADRLAADEHRQAVVLAAERAIVEFGMWAYSPHAETNVAELAAMCDEFSHQLRAVLDLLAAGEKVTPSPPTTDGHLAALADFDPFAEEPCASPRCPVVKECCQCRLSPGHDGSHRCTHGTWHNAAPSGSAPTSAAMDYAHRRNWPEGDGL